jgi:hypothetical protein
MASEEEEPVVNLRRQGARRCAGRQYDGTGHARDLLPANVRIGPPRRTNSNEEAAADKRSNRGSESLHGA